MEELRRLVGWMYICSFGIKEACRLDVHLFIWKQEGWCVDLFEKSHSVVNVMIFMSAVKYMQCICRVRVIVFNVPYVFLES
jgi:hypothetical protein